jgi:N6-L-threonylcarbamoyladenine synthase
MEAHALTPFLSEEENTKQPLAFPFLTLLLSGGHTMLVLASGVGQYKILASTSDDSIGDAFDKAAKHLAIPTDWLRQSPGASLEAFAAQAPPPGSPSEAIPKFTLPLKGKPEFSYSGIKSGFKRRLDEAVAVAGCERVEELPTATRQMYAQAFQAAAFAQVEDKLGLVLARPAAESTSRTGTKDTVRPEEWDSAAGLDDCRHLVVSGGVAANSELRRRLQSIWREEEGRHLLFPPIEYCVDVSITGFSQRKSQQIDPSLPASNPL